MPIPAVLNTPNAEISLKRGFDKLADLLAVTLGPTQGIILSQPAKDGAPELLNDSATIARRMLDATQNFTPALTRERPLFEAVFRL